MNPYEKPKTKGMLKVPISDTNGVKVRDLPPVSDVELTDVLITTNQSTSNIVTYSNVKKVLLTPEIATYTSSIVIDDNNYRKNQLLLIDTTNAPIQITVKKPTTDYAQFRVKRIKSGLKQILDIKSGLKQNSDINTLPNHLQVVTEISSSINIVNPYFTATWWDLLWENEEAEFTYINDTWYVKPYICNGWNLGEHVAGLAIPVGGMRADNQNLSTTDYFRRFTTFTASNTAFRTKGQFLRFLDEDGTIDPYNSEKGAIRKVGDLQGFALQNITGTINQNVMHHPENPDTGMGSGAFLENVAEQGFSAESGNGSHGISTHMSFDASRVARTSTETRPTNISMLGYYWV